MTWSYESAEKVHAERCNLCGASPDHFIALPHRDRYKLPTRLVRCNSCGLRFLNPRMTDDAYEEFYREGHYRRLLEGATKTTFGPENIDQHQEKYAARVAEYLRPHMEPHIGGTLLDVGGSTGAVSDPICREFRLDGTVLEPCVAEGELAESKGLNWVEGVIGDWMPDHAFDVVLLCKTIEHLTDISQALEYLRSILSPEGLLFVDVVKGSGSKVDHCYYLDDSTTRLYLKKAGLAVREFWSMRGIPHGRLHYLVGRA